jgi:hypothetical protein
LDDCILFQKRNDSSSTSACVISCGTLVKLKSADTIRLSKIDSLDVATLQQFYDFVLFSYLENMLLAKYPPPPPSSSSNEEKKKKKEKEKEKEKEKKKEEERKHWTFYYYTLCRLLKNHVLLVNRHIVNACEAVVHKFAREVDVFRDIIYNAPEYIERNNALLQYADMELYEHQRQVFSAVQSERPKLVLYIAPTCTGKTLTPLGISEGHPVIFVCAARHVSLQFARNAISIGKKIAFAFGCQCAEDVRLHYSAAKVFTKDRKSGAIRNVDNTVGDNVEIMICDAQSYIYAMLYMMSFHPANQIVTCWDEPTITLDEDDNVLHSILHRNWVQNLIPNMIFMSATLPAIDEISDVVRDFELRFPGSNVFNIVTHDYKKTIPIIDCNGYVAMLHYTYNDFAELVQAARHVEKCPSLLRYLDLGEIVNFLRFFHEEEGHAQQYLNNADFFFNVMNSGITDVADVTIQHVKLQYCRVIRILRPECWDELFALFATRRRARYPPTGISSSSLNKKSVSEPWTSSSSSFEKGNKVAILGGGKLVRTSSSLSPCISEKKEKEKEKAEMYTGGQALIHLTTTDAHTLTHGPTIYITGNLNKIAAFLIQEADIPESVMSSILEKIEYNKEANAHIAKLEEELELHESKLKADGAGEKEKDKDKKGGGSNSAATVLNTLITKIKDSLAIYYSRMKNVNLNEVYIPNSKLHLAKHSSSSFSTSSAFTSKLDEHEIVSIMQLNDVEDNWKILLLMGIGVHAKHKSVEYTEIVKRLSEEQKLYLIIADKDYIYGTNYQYCHGYIGKDCNTTQELMIQSLGRIGRGYLQQDYTVRFRDLHQVRVLFDNVAAESKKEIVNMNKIFCVDEEEQDEEIQDGVDCP